MTTLVGKDLKKAIFSTLICNVLIWYDYALYGAIMDVIKNSFFPIANDFVQMVAVLGTFAAGFVARPIGALFFGHMGDRHGRRKALLTSIISMSLPVLIIGIMPDYHTIGILAPILLICIRIVQGFSLGGEAGNAVFLLECSPIKIRGLVSSLEVLSAILGALFANIVVSTLMYYLGKEMFFSWGWRIAFIIGIAIGIVATILRYRTAETPIFIEKMREDKVLKSPISNLFKTYKKKLLLAIGIDSIEEASLYVFLVFIVTYVPSELMKHPFMQMMQIVLLILLGIMTLSFAYLSDILQNRKKVIMFASALMLVAAYPMFWLLDSGTMALIILGELIMTIIIAASLGPTSAIVIEMFPAEVRYGALLVSRNISGTLFGGFAPFICLFLIEFTGSRLSAAIYFTFIALLGIVSLLLTNPSKIKELN